MNSQQSYDTKLKPMSQDIAEQQRELLINFLEHRFPECMSEEEIDFDMLRRVLGERVESGTERFGLMWSGKAECVRVIQAPSIATLKPVRSESINFDSTKNLFIEGENLEVLKLLQRSYFRKVKLIYIDPPYNTGQEFIYPDKFTDSLNTYLTYTGQIDEEGHKFSTNTEKTGRYHSKWLNMMYPRLYLARNLLRDDGAIFISIDDHELCRLREICDQIFGEENFKADIVWQKRYTRSNNISDFATVVEHLLVYSKSESFEVNKLPRTDEVNARYSNPDNDARGDWKGASFLSPASPQDRPNLCYPLKNPNTGQIVNPTTRAWRRSKENFEELLADNRLYWGSDGRASVPTIKMFLAEAQGLTPTNFWSHEYAGHTDEGTRDLESLIPGRVFDFPKPVRLIRRILEHVSNSSDDIILDFFAGTCVTAQATMELNFEDGGNRKFIVVQLPEPVGEGTNAAQAGYETISNIGKDRISRVINKLHDSIKDKLDLNRESSIDLGFKVFKLSQSNFAAWEGTVDKIDDLTKQLELHIEHIDQSSDKEDILYELLLRVGFKLTTSIEKLKDNGKEFYAVAGGRLLICLEKDITPELIDTLANADPRQVICLDEGFKGNDQLKTNTVHTFKARAKGNKETIVFRTV